MLSRLDTGFYMMAVLFWREKMYMNESRLLLVRHVSWLRLDMSGRI